MTDKSTVIRYDLLGRCVSCVHNQGNVHTPPCLQCASGLSDGYERIADGDITAWTVDLRDGITPVLPVRGGAETLPFWALVEYLLKRDKKGKKA